MRISDWSSDVCSSDLGGIGAGDEPGRDRRQVIAEAALVLEAGAKPRGGEEVGELRQDAAGQEDAALRAIAQRHVAGEAAEEEAEALEGEAAEIVAAVEARSEEHTSELQSLMRISYAVFCLKKKTITRSTIA